MLGNIKTAVKIFEKNILEIIADYQKLSYQPAFIPVHMNNKIKNKAKRF
jgi:hypothetical protein